MIFDLMATNGGGIKYFTKDGVIYTDLILDGALNDIYYTWITPENGSLKWTTDNPSSGVVNAGILGVENINLRVYKKIFVTIPEYEGYYYNPDTSVGVSPGDSLKILVLKSNSHRPPYNKFYETLIEKDVHPSSKYFEIDVSNINEVCQIWLVDYDNANGDKHILYISEFGVK